MNRQRRLGENLRLVIISSAVLALSAVPLLTGCGDDEAKAQQEAGAASKPVLVSVRRPDVADAVRNLTVNGDIRADRQVTLFSQVPGRVVERPVAMGDAVRSGQMIVVVDYSQLDLSVARARSALATAREQAANVATELERVERLYRAGGASQQQYDAVRTQRKAADEAVTQTQAAVEQATIQRGEADIKAPFAALVGRLDVEVGDIVGPGVPVAVMVDPDPLIGGVHIPERDLGLVHLGQPVGVEVAAYPGRTFAGTVRQISPIIDQRTRMGEVEVLLPNESRLLKPGMFAAVSIEVDRHRDAIMVPSDALIRESRISEAAVSGYERVYHVYVNRGGKAVKAPVELGYTTGSEVEILSGIGAEDSIIVRGQNLVRDGQAVQVSAPAPDEGNEL